MDALSISSSPLSANPLSSLSKPPTFSLRPFLSPQFVKCSLASHQLSNPPITLAPNGTLAACSLYMSAPEGQTMRGAETDVMGMLLRERIIFLGEEISDFVADAIISQLLLLDAQDSNKDIRLFINSDGGSLSSTMALYDVVRLMRADVSTVAMGGATSEAALILGGGTKGKRFAMPNARIMIHQPKGGAGGRTAAVEIQSKELMHYKASFIRIISSFTGRPLDLVEKDVDIDRYMSPIEAAEYGIIDAVIDRDRIIPLLPLPDPSTVTPPNIDQMMGSSSYVIPDIPDDEIY